MDGSSSMVAISRDMRFKLTRDVLYFGLCLLEPGDTRLKLYLEILSKFFLNLRSKLLACLVEGCSETIIVLAFDCHARVDDGLSHTGLKARIDGLNLRGNPA